MKKIDEMVRVIAFVLSSVISAALLSLFSVWGMSQLDTEMQEAIARAVSPSPMRSEKTSTSCGPHDPEAFGGSPLELPPLDFAIWPTG